MIEVEVEEEAWTEALPDVQDWTVRAAEAALKAAPHRLSGEEGGGDEPQLAVLLADDNFVRDLNARFRGKDAATNVLSFPAAESAWPHIGDIALAYGVCTHEALAQAKSFRDHVIHLVVHGVLHLVGYDHETDADAEVMEEIERDVLKGFRIDDPYASRDTHVQF